MCQMNSLSEMISCILKNGNEQPLVTLNENMSMMHRDTYFLKMFLSDYDRQQEEAVKGFKWLKLLSLRSDWNNPVF